MGKHTKDQAALEETIRSQQDQIDDLHTELHNMHSAIENIGKAMQAHLDAHLYGKADG